MSRCPPGRGLDRRQLLLGAPGLAAAWTLGCAPYPRAPGSFGEGVDLSAISGGIVGASLELGHRLRTGDLPEPSSVREVPLLILGGGIAGLSAGWKLLNSGVGDFELLELEDTVGGNSRWGENEVSRFPWGAHYLPLPTPECTAVHELLAEMDLIVGEHPDGTPIYDPRHLCHAPHERVLLDDGWRDGISARDLMSSTEAAELAAFERQVAIYRSWRGADGRPGFALPAALSSPDPELLELDSLSLRQDLDRRGWRSERLRWYLDYCCRDDYGCSLETTSAWAGWHYFCSRPEEVEYLTWPEGNGRVVQHFEARLGDRVRTGQLITRITPTADGSQAGVAVDVLDAGRETVERLHARHVICALPRFVVPYLIAGYELAGVERFTYSPWVVANLTVRRLPEGVAWDNVIYHSRSLGYVVATHQNLEIARQRSVLTYYLPLTDTDPSAARQSMLERSWEEWASAILADLALAHPDIHSRVDHLDVMLWGHAMIRPVPGFFWSEARRLAAEPFGAIHFAHSDMSGLSLFEEAQYQGVKAAEAVMSELGHAYRSSL
ncbi:MAG: FAD-dependent oxidoreductase [Acidobacteriota bacterium]